MLSGSVPGASPLPCSPLSLAQRRALPTSMEGRKKWGSSAGSRRISMTSPIFSPAKQEQWGQALRRSPGSRNSHFLIPENMVSLYFIVKEGSGRSAQGKTPNSFLNGVRKNTSALPSLEAEVIMNMTNYNIGEGNGRHPTPVLLPGKSHGWRSVVGCSPWGREESDNDYATSLSLLTSCIGGGNGNPLQCSCLENPRDGGAWWAAVYGSHRVGHDWSDLAAAEWVTIQIPKGSKWWCCINIAKRGLRLYGK